ncbi:MAG: glycosyltransferase [Myxococcota bacterium]
MDSLTVVVATLERPESVARLLPEVLAQAPADAEVRVVDQSSAPARLAVAETLRQLDDARLVHDLHHPPGLPAARNAGVARSEGRIVLFLDDDVELRPGCIAAHLAAYRDPTVGGVVGRIEERRLVPNAWRVTNRIGRSGRIVTRLDGPDARDIETLKGANMSLRRSAIEQAGGFDVGFGGTSLLEDADLSARVRKLGFRLRYEPDAAVLHQHVPTGGVRHGAPDAAWWRFHNTARYVRRHYGVVAAPELLWTFGWIAVREGLWRRDPRRPLQLLGALRRGWWATSKPTAGGDEP